MQLTVNGLVRLSEHNEVHVDRSLLRAPIRKGGFEVSVDVGAYSSEHAFSQSISHPTVVVVQVSPPWISR